MPKNRKKQQTLIPTTWRTPAERSAYDDDDDGTVHGAVLADGSGTGTV